MPVLDGLRHGEPVDGSASPSFHTEPTTTRQKIVIVGLGMVAVSLMYVLQRDIGEFVSR